MPKNFGVKHVLFLLSHALVALLIYLGSALVPDYLKVFYWSLMVLAIAETKEEIGRLKEAGQFTNNVASNIGVFLGVFKTRWGLLQSVGAAIGATLVAKLLGV